MDIQPTEQQSISDDQELAKVLAGVSQQAAAPEPVADDTKTDAPTTDEAGQPESQNPQSAPVSPAPSTEPPTPSNDSGSLDSIKQEALGELRPLVDKLNVSPEEKFDTYLLLLRSTDDKELITPAYDAARAIADEARKAQALLDIIKEIDYLSGPKQQ